MQKLMCECASNEEVNFTIDDQNNERYYIKMKNTQTIKELKDELQKQNQNILPNQALLYHKRNKLSDDNTIQFYKFDQQKGVLLYVVYGRNIKL